VATAAPLVVVLLVAVLAGKETDFYTAKEKTFEQKESE
jgi:hypothetical protein